MLDEMPFGACACDAPKKVIIIWEKSLAHECCHLQIHVPSGLEVSERLDNWVCRPLCHVAFEPVNRNFGQLNCLSEHAFALVCDFILVLPPWGREPWLSFAAGTAIIGGQLQTPVDSAGPDGPVGWFCMYLPTRLQ